MLGGVAVVTGAGRGIGRQCALELAQRGMRVVVGDVGAAVDGVSIEDSGVADTVAKEINDRGGQAVADSTDVTDHKAVEDLFRMTWDQWGRIDVVVNAAGIIRDRMIWNVTPDEWDRVIDVNLKGPYNTTHHLARLLREHEPADHSGAIVNFASTAGVFGNVGSSSYGAAKAGVIGLTRVTAMELARYRISANCIVPFAWTRMADELPPPDDGDNERLERLRRLAPTAIARVVCHLVSFGTALTGQVVGVRGRELFVLDQPGISARYVVAAEDGRDYRSLMSVMAAEVEPLRSGPEVFDYEPFT